MFSQKLVAYLIEFVVLFCTVQEILGSNPNLDFHFLPVKKVGVRTLSVCQTYGMYNVLFI